VAGFCIALCLLWIVTLLICKCLGRRAGILAGLPPRPDGMLSMADNRQPRPKATILVAICAILIACSGVTFLVRGAISLENLFGDVDNTATGLQQLEQLIADTADDAIDFGINTTDLRDNLVDLLEGGLCNATNPFFDEQADEFNDMSQQVVDAITALSDFSRNELQSIRDTVIESFRPLNDALFDFSNAGDEVSKPLVAYSSAPIIILGIILAIGGLLALRGTQFSTYFCIQTWFILPLLFLLIILACAIAAIISTFLTVNSDMCLGGETRNPEGIVKKLVEKGNLDGVALEATFYYIINSCAGKFSSLNDVDALISDLRTGIETVNDFQIVLKEDQTLSLLCGTDNTRLIAIQGASETVSGAFSEFELIAKDVRGILECKRINDIYVSLHHDLICTSLPYSLAWAFAAMILVFALGMLIFLLRGSLLPAEHMDGMYEGIYSEENIGRTKPSNDDLSYDRDVSHDRDGDGISYEDGSVSYDGRSDRTDRQ